MVGTFKFNSNRNPIRKTLVLWYYLHLIAEETGTQNLCNLSKVRGLHSVAEHACYIVHPKKEIEE